MPIARHVHNACVTHVQCMTDAREIAAKREEQPDDEDVDRTDLPEPWPSRAQYFANMARNKILGLQRVCACQMLSMTANSYQ